MSFTRSLVSSTTAAVANRFVTSTSMKVGAYTLANTTAAHGSGFLVTVTATASGAADTPGTVVVVGTTLAGQTATDTIVPAQGSTVTGTVIYKSLTSVTGAGWVIAEGNDTLTVGVAEGAYVMGSGGELFAVVVNTTAAAAVSLADAAGTFATLKSSIAENTYYYQCAVSGYLKVSTTSTNNLTIIHTPTIPSYATA